MNVKKRGNPNLDDVRCTDTGAANMERESIADEYALDLLGWALKYAAGNGCSMTGFVDWLNERGFKSPRGESVSYGNVKRSLKRVLGMDNPIPKGQTPPANQLDDFNKRVVETLQKLGVR
jgi:hypothetical protein